MYTIQFPILSLRHIATIWIKPVLSNLLSNQKYIGYIVSFDDFFLAQGEKSRRSNIDEDNYQRKATRYNSRSVLSGLLVCAECGHNYRRITRPSGEIVWRCTNRVEHGKKSCQHSPSISEDRIKDVLCEKLGLSTFDGDEIKTRSMLFWSSLMAVYRLSYNVWNILRCSRIKSILAAGCLV